MTVLTLGYFCLLKLTKTMTVITLGYFCQLKLTKIMTVITLWYFCLDKDNDCDNAVS